MFITNLSSLFFQQIRTAEEEAGRVYDPVIGVVKDNNDPDKLGRVKLAIPSLSTEETTWWAPVVAPGAGQNRGWHFLPEREDEVLVMFEHGDVRRPMVVGALWNGVDAPPESNTGGNPRRVYKSRGGSLIEFDDDAGTVTISDGGGKGRIVLDKANKITVEAMDGDVSLAAPTGAVTVVCKEANIEATQTLEVVSQQKISVGAGGPVMVQATGMMQLGSAALGIGDSGAQAPTMPKAKAADVPDPV